MTRIRSYELPHKALRNVISKFSFTLGSVTVSDPDQLRALKALGEEMFLMLNNHVHTENEHTLSQLEMRAPGSSDHDLADHERLESLQDEFQNKISLLRGDEDQDTLHRLYLEFSRYHSQYLEHIYEEETVTEILLQKYFTDDELLEQRAAIMQKIEFPVMLLWIKYAVPAQREEQNVMLLSGFKANAPEPAFQQVMDAIRNEMDPKVFQHLSAHLS
jgi:hypothetical protein